MGSGGIDEAECFSIRLWQRQLSSVYKIRGVGKLWCLSVIEWCSGVPPQP